MNAAIFKVFRHSFVPVLLVVAGVAGLLFLVQFKASWDAEQVIVVEISRVRSQDENQNIGEEELPEVLLTSEKSENPLIQEAQELISRKDWAGAEKIYLSILEKQVSSKALNDLGVFYFRKGEQEKALQYLSGAAGFEPVFANVYFNTGVLYSALNQYGKAVEEYRKTISHFPYHYEAHYNAGVALLKLDDNQGALTYLRKATELSGGSRKAKALYNLGIAYERLGPDHAGEAAAEFTAAIRIRPEYIPPRFKLASLEPESKKGRRRALKQYETILRLKPNFSPAHLQIANIQKALGNKKAAIEAYQSAIDFNPELFGARYNYGLMLLSAKAWDVAAEQFGWIVRRDPGHISARFNLGRAASGKKNYQLALEHYRSALDAKKGQYPEALFNIGLIYKAQKDYDNAIATVKKAVAIREDYAEAWYNLGLIYKIKRDWEHATESLLKAVSIKPDYAKAWYNLGIFYTRLKNEDKAIDAYQRAVAIRPEYIKARINLGIRYSRGKMFAEAIAQYKSVLEMDDTYASAWFNLGAAYYRQGSYGDAEEVLRKALTMEPENLKTIILLARSLRAQKDYREAIEMLSQAVEMDSSNAKYRLELGRTLKENGKLAEARIELVKAQKLEPANESVLQELQELTR